MMSDISHQHIFIGGLHRSGTSVLAQTLGRHPEISALQNTGAAEDEGQHVQSVYKPARRYGGVGKFAYHPKMHMTEDSPLITDENRRKLFEEWAPYWDLTKPWLLEKSPPNLLKTRFLQAMFPEAAFIVVSRNPIATAYATRQWIPYMSLEHLLTHWLHAYDLFQADQPFLKRCHILKFEDFIANPEETLTGIYRFLGVTEAVVPLDLLPDPNAKYLAMWETLQNTPEGREIQTHLQDSFEDRLWPHGYSLF